MAQIFIKDKYIFSVKPKMRLINKDKEGAKKQISLFLKEVRLYNVNLEKLSKKSPTYECRNLMLNIAYYIMQNSDIYDNFNKNREIPYKDIIKNSLVTKSFLEKWRDYICLYTIIISNPNYKDLQEYLNIDLKENEKDVVTLVSKDDKDPIYRGIVLRDFKKSSIIITMLGEIINIKSIEINSWGEEISGREKKGLKHYKKQICIGVVILITTISVFTYLYMNINRTVMIKGTSEIRLQLNIFNRVMKITSPTSKGKELIFSIDGVNKKLDTVAEDIIIYMKQNKMIENNKIIIFINGKKITDKDLLNTEKYILNNHIKVLINNCGEEKKINPMLIEEKKNDDNKTKEKNIDEKKSTESKGEQKTEEQKPKIEIIDNSKEEKGKN